MDGEFKEDRRQYPTCTVPCRPIADKLDRTVSQKMFMWLMGGFAFFVIIVQGGFLWSIHSGIGDLKVDQAIANTKLISMEKRFEDHLKLAEKKFDDLDNLEKKLHFNVE